MPNRALFDVSFHRAQRLVGHMMNEKTADDRFGNRRERGDAEAQGVHDLHEHTGGRFLKRPDDAHPAGERFQMQETEFHSVAINHELRSPGDRDPRACRRHLDNTALRTLVEKTDEAVMRQNARPLFEIGGGLENGFARSVHDD